MRPAQLWGAVALEAASAAGCDRRQNSDTFPTFTRRLTEMSRGDGVSGSHDTCLNIAGGRRRPPLFVFQPQFYLYYIHQALKTGKKVSPFINCSQAKQTWATHSSSRQELVVFNRLINLFHQHLFVAATAVKCYCKCDIMLIIIAVRFLCFPFFFIQTLFFLAWFSVVANHFQRPAVVFVWGWGVLIEEGSCDAARSFHSRRSFTLAPPWIIYLYSSTFVRDEVTLPCIVTDYGSPAETPKGKSNPPPLLANGKASSRSLTSVSLSLWLTFH